jgi:hypothetical protein
MGIPPTIVGESKFYGTLDEVIAAVVIEDDVPQVARHLGRDCRSVRQTVLGPLGLLTDQGTLVDEETLDDRLETISRWV